MASSSAVSIDDASVQSTPGAPPLPPLPDLKQKTFFVHTYSPGPDYSISSIGYLHLINPWRFYRSKFFRHIEPPLTKYFGAPLYRFSTPGLKDSTCVLILATATRQKLFIYSGYIVAHLGVFAFLYQVFQNNSPLMKACIYFQLGMLAFCYFIAAVTIITDRIFVSKALYFTKITESADDGFATRPIPLICTEKCDDVLKYVTWLPIDVETPPYFATITLEFGGYLALIAIEIMTMMYVYQNTSTKGA
ncbi:hypothetical protein BC940DRAFT_308961, partial [Gongronella butleri]